jgi:hypothetical protein
VAKDDTNYQIITQKVRRNQSCGLREKRVWRSFFLNEHAYGEVSDKIAAYYIQSCGVTFGMSLNALSLQKAEPRKETHSIIYPSSRCQRGNHALFSQLDKSQQVLESSKSS